MVASNVAFAEYWRGQVDGKRGSWGGLDNTGQPLPTTASNVTSGGSPGLRSRVGRGTRLVWKSCTVDTPFFDDASPQIDALAQEHGWQILDVRQASQLRSS